MKLVMKDTGERAVLGKTYEDYRGNLHVMEGCCPPHKYEPNGTVHTDLGEFYPIVFGMEWS